MIVENHLTPLTPQEAAAALAAGYRELTGALPTPAVLALLIAHSALETGHWHSIHNFNFGNQKAARSYPLIVQFRCSEVEHGVERFFDPPDPHCNFRAYNSAADGAVDYLRVLRERPHWWRGLHTGDPSAYVDALATPPKYFTANPVLYKSVFLSVYRRYFPLAEVALALLRSPPPSPPAPAPNPPAPPSPHPAPAPPHPPPPVPENPEGEGEEASSSGSSPPPSSPALPSGGSADDTSNGSSPLPGSEGSGGGAELAPLASSNLLTRLWQWVLRLLAALFGGKSRGAR